ncbi:hypothetical protein FB645_002199 [Coemansia sp. IMI 203386]|nr:hypothetical protein FB645_002199 [Coemansia sp. IMI 203386]
MLGINYAESQSKGTVVSTDQVSNPSVTGCFVKSTSDNPTVDHSSQSTSLETNARFVYASSNRLPFPDFTTDSRKAKRKNSALFESENAQTGSILSEHRQHSKNYKQEVFVRYTEKEKLQRKYECKLCKKRFVRPSSLTSHGYTHTGERPFACDHPGCTKRFSVLSNLRRHAVVHTRRRKSSAREKGSKRSSLLQPFGVIATNAPGPMEQSFADNNRVHEFSSAHGSRTLPYYPMSSSFFAGGRQGVIQGIHDIRGIRSTDPLDAADASRLLPSQPANLCQPSSAGSFGSIASSSASFASSLQNTASNALFMYKLPTPVSNSSCNSSPGSKWTPPQLPICLDASRTINDMSNIGSISAASVAPDCSAASLLPAPCTSFPLNATLPGLPNNIATEPQISGYQQGSSCDGSISGSFSDISNSSAVGVTCWPISSSAADSAALNSGSSGSSSLCSSFNDTAIINATLSDILGSAQIASRPAVMTGNSVTTKAMNSAIELLGESRNNRMSSSVSPLPPFSGCSEQGVVQKLSLQQGISSALNSNVIPPLLPLPSVQSCLGQIGGMATAAPVVGSSGGVDGFSINSWLDDMGKSAADGSVGTSTCTSTSTGISSAIHRESSEMGDSVWQLLQACNSSNTN